jgi:Bacillus haemolytic enterotoxin (HBL)
MPNIGPGSLHNQSGPFVLSRPEWLAVQCYVTSAMNLPTDATTLGQRLPVPPPGGMDQFSDLLAGYKKMNDHASFWNAHTLPDSVSCASDIVQYNEKVPIYYGAITKLLPRLQQTPPDPTAQAQLVAILQSLSDDAQRFANHAGTVRDAMTTFDTVSKADAAALQTLHDTYSQKLGDTSPQIAQLRDDIAADKADLDDAMSEYNHDVTVAATSATYAWVFPAGTVAAAVVAGVYGKKATDALARAHGDSAAIDALTAELRSAAIMVADLTRINSDIGDISTLLNAAIPVLDVMRGAWGALSDDLNGIITAITNDIANAPAILMSLGIDEAIADWASVAAEADRYRVNAYISVQPIATALAAGKTLAAAIAKISQQADALSKSSATTALAA